MIEYPVHTVSDNNHGRDFIGEIQLMVECLPPISGINKRTFPLRRTLPEGYALVQQAMLEKEYTQTKNSFN